MTFENLHGLCVNTAEGCKECALGDYSSFNKPQWWTPLRHKRCMGSGSQGAPVMLVGEMPSDVTRNGVHSYRMASRLSYVANQSDYPIVHALQMYQFAPALIYGTTALKCEGKRDGKRQTPMPARFIETCREYHLGVEIEAMRPAVIWVTGSHSADAVRRHFGLLKRETLPVGGMMMMPAPEIWELEKIFLVRTPHPAGNERLSLIDYMPYISGYVERYAYG